MPGSMQREPKRGKVFSRSWQNNLGVHSYRRNGQKTTFYGEVMREGGLPAYQGVWSSMTSLVRAASVDKVAGEVDRSPMMTNYREIG